LRSRLFDMKTIKSAWESRSVGAQCCRLLSGRKLYQAGGRRMKCKNDRMPNNSNDCAGMASMQEYDETKR